jgi:SAM-dependent methyltransferase
MAVAAFRNRSLLNFVSIFIFMKASDYYENIEGRTAACSKLKGIQASGESHLAPFVDRIMKFGSAGLYLDIGCQSGGLIGKVLSAFDKCYGIDIGRYDQEWSKLPDVKFIVHDIDAAALPFPDAYFRVVSCIMVLEHVFDVFGLVKEARRVVQPGGAFVIEVPNAGYFKHILALLKGRVPRTAAQLFPFLAAQGWDGQHLHYFTVSELTWLLNSVGFQVEEIFSRGRFPALRKIYPPLLCSSICMVATAKK